MSTFETNKIPIDKLYNSIKDYIEISAYYDFFKKEFDRHEKEWRSDIRGNHWQDSILRKLLQVHERIVLTDTLFAELDLNSIATKKIEYPSLITYLRLTCFDQLGQPASWMNFDNWLVSKSENETRAEVISKFSSSNPLEITKQLYKSYNIKYSVKNSFYRFLREILPAGNKDKLMSLIRINIYDDYATNPRGIFNTRTPQEEDKEAYLFRLRNDYTHNTLRKGSHFGLKFKNETNPWLPGESIYIKKEQLVISNHKELEGYLREVVLVGLASKILQLSMA